MAGGKIGEVWPFNIRYKRSVGFCSVQLDPESKDRIEATTRFRFILPPKIKVNNG